MGFALPAIAGVWSRDAAAPVQLVVLPLAGMCEGAVLGLAQMYVLRPVVPGLRTGAWVAATSLAAGAAWLLGLLPSATYDTWSGWPVVWTVLLGIPMGAGLLLSIGVAQALVTPRPVRRPLSWVGWTALGWLVGLGAFFAVAPLLWREGQALWLIVLIGGVGGAAMAVTMAAVTGVGAVRLMARASAAGTRLREEGPPSPWPRTLPSGGVPREPEGSLGVRPGRTREDSS